MGAIAIAALTLGACGGATASAPPVTHHTEVTHKPTQTTVTVPFTTTTIASVAPQVAAILLSVSSQSAFLGQTKQWSLLSADLANAAQQLQDLTYPASALADAKSVEAIVEKMAHHAESAPTQGTTRLVPDYGWFWHEENALRHDLGLAGA